MTHVSLYELEMKSIYFPIFSAYEWTKIYVHSWRFVVVFDKIWQTTWKVKLHDISFLAQIRSPHRKNLWVFKVGNRSAKYLPKVETPMARRMLNFILIGYLSLKFHCDWTRSRHACSPIFERYACSFLNARYFFCFYLSW